MKVSQNVHVNASLRYGLICEVTDLISKRVSILSKAWHAVTIQNTMQTARHGLFSIL